MSDYTAKPMFRIDDYTVKTGSDSPMNVNDLQAAKRELEIEITKLLNRFTAKTNLLISEIDVNCEARLGQFSGKFSAANYVVEVEAKL